jgi:hypothetical protein
MSHTEIPNSSFRYPGCWRVEIVGRVFRTTLRVSGGAAKRLAGGRKGVWNRSKVVCARLNPSGNGDDSLTGKPEYPVL